jgi:uncharacterized membrane protein YfcA
MEWWWAAYLLLGLLVGLFAGLLGIGGGIIIVTALVFIFGAQDFPPDRVLHLALGTSLATIAFTSLSNVQAHRRHGAVRWDLVRRAAPGVIAGTALGTLFAEALPSHALAVFFTVFVGYSAVRMWIEPRPRSTRRLPGWLGTSMAAVAVGAVSSLVGAGGGVITIPLMTSCGVPMRNAIGTSAALGLPIALVGAAGYVLAGLDKDKLPALSFGYVYLPALAGIVAGTFVTVPPGARAAHRLPVAILRRVFSAILLVMAVKMVASLL